MNEYAQGLSWTIGTLIVTIYASLWWLGGRPNGRAWRRWIAPLFFSGALIGYSAIFGSFNWWYLLAIPAYKLVTHIGYGANSIAGKIARRASR